MNWKQYRWWVSLFVLILTLIVLTGTQEVWKKYALTTPALQQLKEVDGVKDALVENSKQSNTLTIVKITLANVSNLPKTHQKIRDILHEIFENKKYKLIILDNRTPELEHFYYAIHYSIQEAISTGKFVDMAAIIEKKAANTYIISKVIVDNKFVYVELTKENHSMYVIISRLGDI